MRIRWLARERFAEEDVGLDPSRDCLVVKDAEKGIFHVVEAKAIDWVEAKDGGVVIHVGKDAFASKYTLNAVQRRLSTAMFMRIHRSYLVNRMRILTLKPLWKAEYLITLSSGRSLCTGRAYRAVIEALLK
jgi:DNA-binding LytR/AlgR family response regulator